MAYRAAIAAKNKLYVQYLNMGKDLSLITKFVVNIGFLLFWMGQNNEELA